jgi:hypothetical protein
MERMTDERFSEVFDLGRIHKTDDPRDAVMEFATALKAEREHVSELEKAIKKHQSYVDPSIVDDELYMVLEKS